jgi:HPt (histidine-containing phosphotransfer) domain-containing protein
MVMLQDNLTHRNGVAARDRCADCITRCDLYESNFSSPMVLFRCLRKIVLFLSCPAESMNSISAVSLPESLPAQSGIVPTSDLRGKWTMSDSNLVNNTSGAQVVDLMALLGRCLGNFKMVERVLSTFRVTGKSDLEQLERAIESADLRAAAEISHRFHGAAGNVSAIGLRALLHNAERLAREERRDELLMLLGQLHSEWEEFERYSQSFASSSSNLLCSQIR